MPPGPQCASAPVQSSDSSSEDNGDDSEEDSTMEPEVSCFIDKELLAEWKMLIFMAVLYSVCLRSLT